jgi:hypothetical protein
MSVDLPFISHKENISEEALLRSKEERHDLGADLPQNILTSRWIVEGCSSASTRSSSAPHLWCMRSARTRTLMRREEVLSTCKRNMKPLRMRVALIRDGTVEDMFRQRSCPLAVIRGRSCRRAEDQPSVVVFSV